MRNSIDPFGMRITDWVDERRDFWKSTQGALRKLEENYRLLGDWPLALAAYNAGQGAISGIIRQTGIRDYWTLSARNQLKTETVHYVPKLLAAAYVLSNARQYGIVLWPVDPDWTRIPVNRPVDLNLLAAEAGVDPAMLKMANRELNYYITPPGNYLLKVQAQDAAKVSTALARGLPLINYYIHTIRSGDTLLALAIHYGISVDQITSMNPGVQARNLRIGSTLMIPAIREAPSMPPASSVSLNFSGSYEVKRGDSLWSIALAHGVTPEALAEANGMALNDILREGRVLKTPIR
jgi:membrane-bound lytic murein transglycosylase D